MVNRSLLISGNEVPFPQGQMFITQPKVKDILLFDEKDFFRGCELLTFSKEILSDKDKSLLNDRTNFDVLMSIINDDSEYSEQSKINCENIFMLLFPGYDITFKDSFIMLMREGELPHSINNENFEDFKLFIKDILCLNKSKKDEQDYNPSGDAAKKLAERFKERQQKLAKLKGQNLEDNTIFDRYISILAVGLQMDINIILNYTLYQLYDIFERYNLKETYDISMQARLAGASSENLDKVEHWMNNIHS